MGDVQATGPGPANDQGASKGLLGRAFDFVLDHPKTSMLGGAVVSAAVGAELVAAALVGGAFVMVFRPRAPKE